MSCNNRATFLTADQARIHSRNESIIFSEICAIQQAILQATHLNEYEVVVADQSTFTSTNAISSIFVTNPGTGYSTLSATATIVHSQGTGATVEPVVSGGSITGFIVTNPGSGYGPVQPTVDATLRGNGDATVEVFEVGGQLVGASVVNPGTGYLVGDELTIVHPVGVGADVEVAQINMNGGIVALNIVDPGQDYDTEVAQVSVQHPTGVNFSGQVVVVNGEVTDVVVVDGGLGYGTLAPEVIITDTTGAGAEAFVTLANGGAIQSITLSNPGSGYSNNTTVSIQDVPGGTGSLATAEAIVTNTVDSQIYHRVFTGQETSIEISDQLEQVTRYFQQLGYNIQIEVNPTTQNTIQWHIFW